MSDEVAQVDDGEGFPDIYLVNYAGNAIPGATLDRMAGRTRLRSLMRDQSRAAEAAHE